MPPSTPALTPTSYLVLGLLASCGPSTSYDLEQRVAGSVGAFWSFPRSQLYREPARLVAAGLVAEQREQAGRRRRTLTLTDDGRSALQDWLATPVGALTEIRDLGLLKLFFGGEAASPQDVAAGARAQSASHRRQLAVYEELSAHAGMERHQAATLRLGTAYEQSAIAFWDAVATEAGSGPA